MKQIEKALSIVARRNNLGSTLVTGHLSSYWKEAMQEYADIKTKEFLENVKETLYSHYKNNGGFTRLAAGFIEKLDGKKWERDQEIEELKKENEALKNEIKQLKKT